jgi:hypothetical protein
VVLHKEDKMTANFLSEMTNQVVGANAYFEKRLITLLVTD